MRLEQMLNTFNKYIHKHVEVAENVFHVDNDEHHSLVLELPENTIYFTFSLGKGNKTFDMCMTTFDNNLDFIKRKISGFSSLELALQNVVGIIVGVGVNHQQH